MAPIISLYNVSGSCSIITILNKTLSQEQNTRRDDENENSGSRKSKNFNGISGLAVFFTGNHDLIPPGGPLQTMPPSIISLLLIIGENEIKFELAAGRAECSGFEIFKGYLKSIYHCAEKCYLSGSLFIFGTWRFGDNRCNVFGKCMCYCEASSRVLGECDQTLITHNGFMLFRYIYEGGKFIISNNSYELILLFDMYGHIFHIELESGIFIIYFFSTNIPHIFFIDLGSYE